MDASTTTKNIAVRTELLSDPTLLELTDLVQLINDVYDVAEANMWKTTGVRTNLKELQDLVSSRHLIVARCESNNDEICGCVKLERIDDATGGFGMLVVAPQHRGLRIGNKLVEAAENWARGEGYQTMQLTLLTPKSWKQPSKEFNRAWYTRIGYTPQETVSFQESYPQFIPLLSTDCDFTVWTKPLTG